MSVAAPAIARAAAEDQGPLRVLVVDDAIVVRGLVSRWLNAEPDIEVVGALRNGQDAVDQIESIDPDIVLLDVEMPVLNGLSALPLLLEKKRDLIVIMASTLTSPNSEVSLKAISLGAVDCIPKPESGRDSVATNTYKQGLIDRVRRFGAQRRQALANRRACLAAARAQSAALLVTKSGAARAGSVALRPFSVLPPQALVIGASTGGPHALALLTTAIGAVIKRVPVLITQHMPATFTSILAEHLARASGHPAREARDGEVLAAGVIRIAPGGRHMRVARREGRPVVALDDEPPVNFCKPAVDPLFSSAAAVWGGATLAVVLTGMGVDGTRGATDIVARRGSVIAQDEATSVVWGMPGSVAHAGLCSAVLPLEQIATTIVRLFPGERP
jgi:two-component system, chemotaxis family, protein-glutamate methylesterase/glutaminase